MDTPVVGFRQADGIIYIFGLAAAALQLDYSFDFHQRVLGQTGNLDG